MQRMLCIAGLIALASSGCAMLKSTPLPAPAEAPLTVARPAPPQLVDANGAPIQALPFVGGQSSVTVENLAKAQSCKGGEGAALVTPAGPVEVYRMRCDNGRVFMARCELRQCKQM